MKVSIKTILEQRDSYKEQKAKTENLDNLLRQSITTFITKKKELALPEGDTDEDEDETVLLNSVGVEYKGTINRESKYGSIAKVFYDNEEDDVKLIVVTFEKGKICRKRIALSDVVEASLVADFLEKIS